jgi:DNA topoisomerase IA
MEVKVRFNPQGGWPYELYLDGRYYASFRSEEEALRAAERERRWREHEQWRKEYVASLPSLSEWAVEEIIEAYSPYAIHPYSTDELDAELARRFGIEVGPGQRVADVLLERGLIDEETWERITNFWDGGTY